MRCRFTRSLPVFISEQLTKSLTHSLVPSLTQALSITSDQRVWCQNVHRQGNIAIIAIVPHKECIIVFIIARIVIGILIIMPNIM